MSKHDLDDIDTIGKKAMGLDDEFTFGKHKGETLEEVIDSAPSYVFWCLENIDTFRITEEAREYLGEESD